MANPEHLAILKQGVKAWNEWRKENPSVRPDLSKAEIGATNLATVDFSRANLVGANLSGTIEFRIKNGTVCGILGVCDHKELHSNYKSGVNAPSSC